MRIEKVGLLQSVTRKGIAPAVEAAALRLREVGCRVFSDRKELTGGDMRYKIKAHFVHFFVLL